MWANHALAVEWVVKNNELTPTQDILPNGCSLLEGNAIYVLRVYVRGRVKCSDSILFQDTNYF